VCEIFRPKFDRSERTKIKRPRFFASNVYLGELCDYKFPFTTDIVMGRTKLKDPDPGGRKRTQKMILFGTRECSMKCRVFNIIAKLTQWELEARTSRILVQYNLTEQEQNKLPHEFPRL